jgi:hypothetical protein
MIISFLFNGLLVGISVLIHFEVLNLLTIYTPNPKISRRVSILLGIFGSLCAHLLEIWIFGIGIFLLLKTEIMGKLEGNTTQSFMDCVYFSLTTYTSLGFGDIAPTGWIRFLAGMETLTGLVLIAWTASFMFLEMQKHWRIK